MKSNMNHRFSDAPTVSIPRSTFNRTHNHKTTFDAGYLVPIFVDEALPGDTFNVSVEGFARLSTPVYPIMDNMYMETFFFAVPNRLIWDNWQKFCGERVDPGDSIDYTIPQVAINNQANESLTDYFGLPTQVAADVMVDSLHYRAYNLIYNEWFRDQNLQDSLTVDKDNGPDTIGDYVLKRRGKRHDYFTSCLPWLQKGDSVLLSLGDTAPVGYTGNANAQYLGLKNDLANAGGAYIRSLDNGVGLVSDTGNSVTNTDYQIVTDLSQATSSTINELREAFQVQRLLEKDARSGTRYREILKSHFSVSSDDARLQRPEYLGGGSTPVRVGAVARTDSSPGELGALGTAEFQNHGFVKSFSEHCVIIGLVNVRADLTYQEGIDKMWLRQTRYDFYWPTLAHLGEQAVENQEIYIDAATHGAGTHTDVFGYQERYAEYRYKPSKITGKFRSNDAGTLDPWHLSLEFGAQPTLDATFIEDNPPIDRCIATPSEPHFKYDSFVRALCTRPMPVYSIPGYTDHF